MKENPIKKMLGNRILAIRHRHGMTQQKAADLYGCSLRWWQELERGRNVSLLVLQKVARALKVEVWQLLK